MLDNVLSLYDSRIKVLSLNYLVNKAKSKFTCFSDEESFSLSVQLLDFIMQQSFKAKHCFKEDMYKFMGELNKVVYKKELSSDELEEVVDDLINKLRSKGEVFHFETYNHEKGSNIEIPVRLIATNSVFKDEDDRYAITYSLTESGYRFLLGTKEYDDLLGIEVSRIIAQIKLENGDFEGTVGLVQDIKNAIHLQLRKVFECGQKLKKGLNNVKTKDYEYITKNTLEVIIKEKSEYQDLKRDVNSHIKTKEKLKTIRTDGDNSKLEKSITLLNRIGDDLSNIEKLVWDLIEAIQSLQVDYENAIMNALKVMSPKMLDFETNVLGKIEEDLSVIDRLDNLYKPLFPLSVSRIYSPLTPYFKQDKLIEEDTSSELEAFDSKTELEKEQEIALNKKIASSENFFADFFEELLKFKIIKEEFTLREFFNYLITEDKATYIKVTRDTELLREIVIFLSETDKINFTSVASSLKDVDVSGTEILDIHRVVLNIINRDSEVVEFLSELSLNIDLLINQNEDVETIKVKTEIDLENMSFAELSCADCKFY